jgi:hypothetical protein
LERLVFSQNFHLKIIGSSAAENKVIDSLKYNSIHTNVKNSNDELKIISERLSNAGYIENKLLENTKKNDSTYIAKFSLGDKIKFIHIYIGKNFELKKYPRIRKK